MFTVIAMLLFGAYAYAEGKHVWYVSQHDLTNTTLEFKGINHSEEPQIVVVRIRQRLPNSPARQL